MNVNRAVNAWANGKHIDLLLGDRRQAVDARAMANLSPLTSRYLPWTGSALRPSVIDLVCRELVLNAKRSVLELGSGLSTLVLATLRANQGLDFSFVSLEGDAQWHAVVGEWLDDNGLSDQVDLVLSPLNNEVVTPWSTTAWFELPSGLTTGIDCLLVDGPAAHSPDIRYARWPALPLLADYLDWDRITVILDDISRTGERRVFADWQRRYRAHALVTDVDHVLDVGIARGVGTWNVK